MEKQPRPAEEEEEAEGTIAWKVSKQASSLRRRPSSGSGQATENRAEPRALESRSCTGERRPGGLCAFPLLRSALGGFCFPAFWRASAASLSPPTPQAAKAPVLLPGLARLSARGFRVGTRRGSWFGAGATSRARVRTSHR